MSLTHRLKSISHIFAAVILIIQPVMDVISFWMEHFSMSNTPTLLMRMGVLGITLLTAFIISDKKHTYIITAAIIAVVYAGHIFTCYQVGIQNIVSDFSNYIRIIQMPLLVFAFITFLKANTKTYDAMQIGASIALLFMFMVIIISTITGTDPHTYIDGTGILGWFNNTNSQSSNLCVLSPILFLWVLNSNKRRPILIALTAIICCLSMFFFSTRLAYLGLMAFTFGLGVMIIVLRRKDWRYGAFMLVLSLVFAVLLPISPTISHLNKYNSSQDERQSQINSQIDTELVEHLKDDTDDGLNDEERKEILVEELTPIYEIYVGDFVKQFGARETMKMFNYTTDTRVFSALRPKKLMFAQMLMDSSPKSAILFGIELDRFTFNERVFSEENPNEYVDRQIIYDVENDFHGIYYLYGAVGLVAYLLFLLYFVFLIAKALLKNFKKFFTLDAVGYGIALILCLVHAYNTAGVLRRPNASVYLSLVLAIIYYLIKIKKYDNLPQEKQVKTH